ncbi:MAG: hypothetical protein JNJ54_00150 [Myxococcaceae bacterium]|nr:hypothetical protein [Myxococcaceae bacterium]
MIAALLATSAARADEWWGPDKALHLGVSAVIAGGSYGVASLLSGSQVERAAAGLVLGLSAGIAKEVLDALGTGAPSLRDLTWDLVGSVAGAALAFVLDRWLVTPLLETIAPRFAG